MALLQVGTFFVNENRTNGDDTVVVEIPPDTWAALKSSGMILMAQNEETTWSSSERYFRVHLGDLDVLRPIVSEAVEDIDDQLIEVLVKLVDISIDSIIFSGRSSISPHIDVRR